MPTISVKLADAVKARIDEAAASRGVTAHAFMVEAIEQATLQDEWHRSFVEDALRARNEMVRTGKVYDGEEVAAYMRAKLAGRKTARPRARQLSSYKTRTSA